MGTVALLIDSIPYELTGGGMQQPRTWQSKRHSLYGEYTYEMQFIFSVQPRANTFLSKGLIAHRGLGLANQDEARLAC